MDAKGGNTIRILKGRMDKRAHYVQIKRWRQKGHYDVQIKRPDGQGRL